MRPSSSTSRQRESKAAPLSARGVGVGGGGSNLRNAYGTGGSGASTARAARESSSAMRACRGAFNVSCTTTKAPKLVMQEIQRSLNQQKVCFKNHSAYIVRCKKQNLSFDVEVSHLDNLESVYVIRFFRIAGEMNQYKDLCSKLLNDMRV